MALPLEMDVLTSNIRPDEKFIDFALEKKPVPKIEKATDIIIRLEATPINPSDIGVIFGAADRLSAQQTGPNTVSAPIPPHLLGSMRMTPYGTDRKGGVIPGNEGSGIVVAAGSEPKAQALIGKTVAVYGNGGCYAGFRKVNGVGNAVIPMPDGVTPQQAASSFINPMTALGFIHTMKSEGHTALVHTAAASQLGQMLMRICMADQIPLVNVVRRQEQIDVLKSINPDAICINQSLPTFEDDLVNALQLTGATLCFDATGGGSLASQIMQAFEKAGQVGDGVQMCTYGMLDTSPSTMTKEQRQKSVFWLLSTWQAKNKDAWKQHLQRVAKEITTTFVSSFCAEVAMAQAVTVSALNVYGKQETGKKYLLNPQRHVPSKL